MLAQVPTSADKKNEQQKQQKVMPYRLMKLPKLLRSSVLFFCMKSDQLNALSFQDIKKKKNCQLKNWSKDKTQTNDTKQLLVKGRRA